MGAVLPIFYTSNLIGLSSVTLLLSVVFAYFLFRKRRSQNVSLVAFCIFFGLTIGLFRGGEVQKINQTSLSNLAQQTVSFEGRIVEYPDKREGYTFLTIGDISISDATVSEHERILIHAQRYPEYKYGDIVTVRGTLTPPTKTIESVEGAQSRFRYDNFLSKDNIYYVVYRPEISLKKYAEKSFIGMLYYAKDKCVETSERYMNEPMSGLLVGILFGIKKALGSEMLGYFTAAGLVHLVVLSGYNIAVVIEGITRTTRLISKRGQAMLVTLGVTVFILFVGPTPAVVRAGAMALLVLYARRYGANTQVLSVVALALALVTLYNSRSTLYDPGVALSFLATLGLIIFTPFFSHILAKVPEKFLFRESIANSLSVILTTTPYLLWYMGTVSLVGLVTNLLVTALVPVVMLLGLLYVVSGVVVPQVSLVLSIPLSLLLSFIIKVAEFFGTMSLATVSFNISTVTVTLLYIFVVFFAVFCNGRLKRSG
jgi:competence protein ComEC